MQQQRRQQLQQANEILRQRKIGLLGYRQQQLWDLEQVIEHSRNESIYLGSHRPEPDKNSI